MERHVLCSLIYGVNNFIREIKTHHVMYDIVPSRKWRDA